MPPRRAISGLRRLCVLCSTFPKLIDNELLTSLHSNDLKVFGALPATRCRWFMI